MPTKKKQSNPLNNIKLAFSFLTVIPISVETNSEKKALAAAMKFFPLVGFCMALITLAAVSAVDEIFTPRLNALLLVLFPIILSGGLHVDGLADCFDAFFQGKTKEDILRVMRDSRIGVWGAISVVFLILIKWELIVAVPVRTSAYLFALTASRWAQVAISYLLPYARTEEGLGKDVAGHVQKQDFLFSTLLAAAASLVLGLKGLVILAAGWGFIYLLSRFYKRKIDGITGDVIGATCELTEVFIYVIIILLHGTNTF